MKVYIKNRKRRKEDYMYFMQSFVEAAIACGIKGQNQYFFPNKKLEKKIIHYADTILTLGEFYQFNLSSCIRQQNSLTAQFVSFSLSNLANIFYPPQFLQ